MVKRKSIINDIHVSYLDISAYHIIIVFVLLDAFPEQQVYPISGKVNHVRIVDAKRSCSVMKYFSLLGVLFTHSNRVYIDVCWFLNRNIEF